MVQARVGCTLINVSLAVRTAESGSAGANVSAGHVLTGASVHARVRQTLVDVDVTVAAHPAGLAHAFVAVDLVLAVAVNTGVAGTFVVLREAGGIAVTLRTVTGKGVYAIDAGATVVTRVYCAVIDVDVTHRTCVSGFTNTLVAVDLVDALAVVTWFTLTVVDVYLTVNTHGSLGAGTGVRILSVLAGASVSAGLTQALVDIALAQSAGVSRATVAGESGHAVSTHAVMTRTRCALVDVQLAVSTSETCSAFTGVFVGSVRALAAIFTGCTGALVHIHLTQIPREPFGAFAVKRVDLVHTLPVVETGLRCTIVSVYLTKHPLVTWHANAVKSTNLIEAGGIILTWV